jgi:hypothetical protein
MKNQIRKQVSCSLIEKLKLNKKVSERENFNEWMLNKVKSIHYSNNQAMCSAYDRIEEKHAYN